MTISFSILGLLAIPMVLFAIMVGVYTYINKKYASVPFELLNSMTDVPAEHKERAAECFKDAYMAPPVNIVYSRITKK